MANISLDDTVVGGNNGIFMNYLMESTIIKSFNLMGQEHTTFSQYSLPPL